MTKTLRELPEGRNCTKCGEYKSAENFPKQLIRRELQPSYYILGTPCKACRSLQRKSKSWVIPKSRECVDVAKVTSPVCYLLQFPDNTFYIGSTGNLCKRVQQHQMGRPDNTFKVKIISVHDTRKEAFDAEFYCILKYRQYPNCLNKNSGKANPVRSI